MNTKYAMNKIFQEKLSIQILIIIKLKLVKSCQLTYHLILIKAHIISLYLLEALN